VSIPREEITVPRQVVLECVKTLHKPRRTSNYPQRLELALKHIADVGYKQGYRTARWLLLAEPAWLLAHHSDAHTAYGNDIGDDHPALIAERALQAALDQQAPSTCRAMAKQLELGEV
jgi:hypothetical protein